MSPFVWPRAWAWAGGRLFPAVVFQGPARARRVALTIDDGPDPVSTPLILDTLARLEVRATFFLIGERVQAAPETARAIAAAGHEIGHHMWRDHPTIRLPMAELVRGARATTRTLDALGPVQWFRPGGGWVSRRIIRVAARQRLRVVVGDVPPIDTHLPFPRLVALYMNRIARPGAILTVHDHGRRGRRTAASLEHLVPALKKRGFEVGTLSALAGEAAIRERERPRSEEARAATRPKGV